MFFVAMVFISNNVELENSDSLFSVTLHQTDVMHNTNSYYKMQLLKDDTREKYYVFRSWGRVGTNIGGVKTDWYGNLSRAVDCFEE